MCEDDAEAIAEIKAQTGHDYSAPWQRQRQTVHWLEGNVGHPSFIDEMWRAFGKKCRRKAQSR